MHDNDKQKLYNLLRNPSSIKQGEYAVGEDHIRIDQAMRLAHVLYENNVRVLSDEEISMLSRIGGQEERWHRAIGLDFEGGRQ
jgi:hypothetical protein